MPAKLRDDTSHQGQGLARRLYPPRIVGMGLGFTCVASVFYQQATPPAAWLLAIFHGLAWPHLAYWTAKSNASPHKAEIRNLMIDSALVGFWVGAMSFNLLPSVILISMLSMSNISVGGMKLFSKGWFWHLAGAGAALLLCGFHLRPEPTMVTMAMSLPTLMIYPVMIGMVAYRLQRKLNWQKKELQDSLAKVKTLSGLLPICASCKKIRNDQGYWSQIEVYIRDHSEAEFSHGLCPDCVKKLYPEIQIDSMKDPPG